MSEEEYVRLSNLVKATIEQQAQFAEDLRSIGEQTKANNEGIRALLAIAEIHEREIRSTDDRLNVLINVVERQISDRNGKAEGL